MDLINSDPVIKESLKEEYIRNKKSPQLISRQYLIKEPNNRRNGPSTITIDDDDTELGSKWPTGFMEQYLVLFRRSLKLSIKDQFTWLNVIQALFVSIITGLCWLRMPFTESKIPDRTSFVFFVMIFWPSQTLFAGLMSFPSERSIIARERASGSYRLSAYFLAKSSSEAPLKLVLPTMFMIISYWMANINPFFPTFLAFLALELVAILVAESIGLFIGASVQNLKQAFVVAVLALLSFMLVGGFFIQILPHWLGVWAKWLSFFKYAFDACLRLEFSGNHLYQCEGGTFIDACRQPNATTFVGQDSLKYLKVDLGIGENFIVLFAMLIGFRFLAYISLRFVKDNNGRN
ncbi:unnamed protein product [Rotaria magnacalcarata]|uniref:ABC-2 type transporter transmembrane domain-containing protein n=1 Tax=Rotaria magnacalcarata TaxID=392030 RepID=A0A816V7W1_9BILA|nr:unnamed protein product [Rotaria magnacalcarata]CAF4036641.1 unnamed protein product [Rotaria magnacalcarata]